LRTLERGASTSKVRTVRGGSRLRGYGMS
jgi:hypothetical protein